MERIEIEKKLDRITLYLTEQRFDLSHSDRNIREWENLMAAIGIIEAARKNL